MGENEKEEISHKQKKTLRTTSNAIRHVFCYGSTSLSVVLSSQASPLPQAHFQRIW